MSLQVEPLTDKAWLVQKRGGSTAPLVIRPVDGRTWVVQNKQRPRRSLRRIGSKGLRTHLLVDERITRAGMNRFQKRLGDYLASEQIAWTLRELGINCVLDVGANIGQYGQMLREVGYKGRIVSFEPLSALAEPLREAAAKDPDWIVFHCALGDEEVEAQINVVPGGMSSLLKSSEFGKQWRPHLQEARPERIQIRRLESVFDEAVAGLAKPRVYLKMDTQGYDLQAFRGAGTRLAEILGLQSEVACVSTYAGMPRLPEQMQEYEAEGFEVVGMFPVSRHLETLRIIELDMVMVRTEAMYQRARA